MKLLVLFKISLKYLWRYRRRYLFLFLALGFGFGVLTVIGSLKDGMKENLYLSAQSHYAGDITALGYSLDSRITYHLTKSEQGVILASAEAAVIDPVAIVTRTTVQGMNEGAVYFNGNAIALKYIVGVDWEQEKDYFERLSYTESPALFDEDSILISSPIAEELGANQGDGIILEVSTATGVMELEHTGSFMGLKNTGTFIVSGIVEDSSFFGYYKVYMSKLTLNRLIGFADEDCSLIGFFLKDRKTIEDKRKLLYDDLQTRISTGPLVYDRKAFEDASAKLEEKSVFLLTLPVHLSEVAQLMNAVDLASYVLFGMMLAIIMVSAMVCCSLILHERTRETGTMRAIGFYEADLRLILQLEIVTMALFSMTAGFLLALLINRFLSYGSFNWFPGFEVFMQNGRLAVRYLPHTIAINVLATACALILAIGGPIFRYSRNPLPEMLKGDAL